MADTNTSAVALKRPGKQIPLHSQSTLIASLIPEWNIPWGHENHANAARFEGWRQCCLVPAP